MNTLLAALAGVLTWSLMEYVIHRFLGHDRRLMPNPFAEEHIAHHSRGNYFAPTWKKLLTAAAFAAALAGPSVWALGWGSGLGFVAGVITFYGYYEVLHRLEHVHEGVGAYGRWARRHHFYHHFHDPRVNHGVTSPIWDLVFGTWVRPEVIAVPPKLQMAWLCDPATGQVWPHLADSYRLRGAAGATRTGTPLSAAFPVRGSTR